VKISFISARFKLKTCIVESDAPRHLRAEGTGEDSSVASSLKQVSEMWLTEGEGGGTELRMKVKADVLGRMGSFGLGVMKTKADRMWDEFGVNANLRLAGGDAIAAAVDGAAPAVAAPVASPVASPVAPPVAAPAHAAFTAVAAPASAFAAAPMVVPASAIQSAPPGFWARLFGASQDIRVEVVPGNTHIRVQWPVGAAPVCAAWLRSLG
jgi:hypothetical protein